MTIDGQELVRLENPSYLATNDLYSKNSPQLLTDRQQYNYGNCFRTKIELENILLLLVVKIGSMVSHFIN